MSMESERKNQRSWLWCDLYYSDFVLVDSAIF